MKNLLYLFLKAEKAISIANELHVSFTQLHFSYKKVGGLKPPKPLSTPLLHSKLRVFVWKHTCSTHKKFL